MARFTLPNRVGASTRLRSLIITRTTPESLAVNRKRFIYFDPTHAPESEWVAAMVIAARSLGIKPGPSYMKVLFDPANQVWVVTMHGLSRQKVEIFGCTPKASQFADAVRQLAGPLDERMVTAAYNAQ